VQQAFEPPVRSQRLVNRIHLQTEVKLAVIGRPFEPLKRAVAVVQSDIGLRNREGRNGATLSRPKKFVQDLTCGDRLPR
jgi:hypothetical protein